MRKVGTSISDYISFLNEGGGCAICHVVDVRFDNRCYCLVFLTDMFLFWSHWLEFDVCRFNAVIDIPYWVLDVFGRVRSIEVLFVTVMKFWPSNMQSSYIADCVMIWLHKLFYYLLGTSHLGEKLYCVIMTPQ